jgi:hypothetical protein
VSPEVLDSKRAAKKKYLLPSDRLSPGELKKLNGEIVVYEMKVPISWSKFKGYPIDIQKEYLQWFADEFHATAGMMASIFGIHPSYAASSIVKMGLHGILHRSQKDKDVAAFREWLKQYRTEEEVKETPAPEEPKKEKVKIVEQPMFFNTITGCEMNFEGKASEISQSLFTLFRDQRIAVSVVFLGAKEEPENESESEE